VTSPAPQLVTGRDALHRWSARTGNYVADGHRAIDSIDHLLRELYRLRADLVDEIRQDQDERIARVDRWSLRTAPVRMANSTGRWAGEPRRPPGRHRDPGTRTPATCPIPRYDATAARSATGSTATS
jgi:hypothetical protein